ncbi:MAG TPA: 16S rRNA (guanine(527)-N(7))-methyltransferase RsmG, partial [Amaricoccus sp.]|nr:16S rRNA (guanine(527)-N(7))-methyltransferase RsmG [Amaricoccus sp.]
WDRLPAQGADVVSARALAPLSELLSAAEIHRRPGGLGLFPKGETVHKEIAEASVRWRFDHKLVPSLTNPRAAILEIGAIERA